jgi:2'-5' RNA ligase
MDWTHHKEAMKAAIALLSDYSVQNAVRRMVYEICQLGEIEFIGSLLPAHVSLKQPFTFENMESLEGWFDSFSQQVTPFRIELEEVYYDGWEEYAIVGLGVKETPILRELHNRINRELKDVVKNPAAPHDGDEYRFHLTIELGRVADKNPFKKFYESLAEKQVDLSFLAEHIALFYYPEQIIEPGTFICHKILPLTGK